MLSAAYPGVMAAIEKCVVSVPLRRIQQVALFEMPPSRNKLAEIE
jgi:hypothetical protein